MNIHFSNIACDLKFYFICLGSYYNSGCIIHCINIVVVVKYLQYGWHTIRFKSLIEILDAFLALGTVRGSANLQMKRDQMFSALDLEYVTSPIVSGTT